LNEARRANNGVSDPSLVGVVGRSHLSIRGASVCLRSQSVCLSAYTYVRTRTRCNNRPETCVCFALATDQKLFIVRARGEGRGARCRVKVSARPYRSRVIRRPTSLPSSDADRSSFVVRHFALIFHCCNIIAHREHRIIAVCPHCTSVPATREIANFVRSNRRASDSDTASVNRSVDRIFRSVDVCLQ
jgi:hypothetical protein